MYKIDLLLTADGDLNLTQLLGQDGSPIEESPGVPYEDMELAIDKQVIIQGVMSRIKTAQGEWYTYPGLGANLEGFLGEQNTAETAAMIVKNVERALTYDGFVPMQNLDIYVVPVNPYEIIVYIRIEYYRQDPITIPVPFSYADGLGG